MPASAVPVVAAAFSLFIVVVGGVSIWTCLPARPQDDPAGGGE